MTTRATSSATKSPPPPKPTAKHDAATAEHSSSPSAERHVPIDRNGHQHKPNPDDRGKTPPLKKARLHSVFKDQFVNITSDEKLSKTQAQGVAKKVEDAAKFDTDQQKWKDQKPFKNPVNVEVLSKKGFDQALGGDSTGVAGVTLGPDTMAVPDNLLSRKNPDDDDTLAHEFDHVQDFRQAGQNIDKIPVYLQEGKAYTIGDMYPKALGEDKQDPALPRIAKQVGSVTGDQARDVMDNYRDGSAESDPSRDGFRDETTGALFVQYMKTRAQNGDAQGFSDVLPRMAQLTADVGKGSSYDDAFQKQFGMGSKDAEDAFVKYVRDTEGKPAERLKGTIWEPYLGNDASNSRAAPHRAEDWFKAAA